MGPRRVSPKFGQERLSAMRHSSGPRPPRAPLASYFVRVMVRARVPSFMLNSLPLLTRMLPIV